jgi:hypothetical protein
MSIAFLEGAEYEAATRQSAPEETVMTIDYAERYDDKQIHRMLTALYGNGGIRLQTVAPVMTAMRDELIAAIDELRSTIAAQHDTSEDQEALIAQQIELLDEKSFTQMAATISFQQFIVGEMRNECAKSGARIAELEAQLAAALATIEHSVNEESRSIFYVVTDNGRLLGSSPVAHDDLQHLADSENIGVYEIRGVRTGRYADPKTEIERLRIVAIEGDTVWAFTDDFGGGRTLYSGVIGQPLDVVGASMAGIPADCPPHVSDIFWTKNK